MLFPAFSPLSQREKVPESPLCSAARLGVLRSFSKLLELNTAYSELENDSPKPTFLWFQMSPQGRDVPLSAGSGPGGWGLTGTRRGPATLC